MLNESLYWVFLVGSLTTIASPGPGVLMALTNCLNYGFRRSVVGILGCALGTAVMGLLSVTGLGWLIANTPTLYAAIRLFGIAYLVYLGVKKWNSKPFTFSLARMHRDQLGAATENPTANDVPGGWTLLGQGVLLQMSNPALIIFYLSLFPQCVDQQLPYWPQVIFLVINYFVMVFIVHSIYGYLADHAANRLSSPKAGRLIQQISAFAYWAMAAYFLYMFVF